MLWILPRNIHTQPILDGFISLGTHDVIAHWMGETGLVDRSALDAADRHKPDLIIYTGENGGILMLTTETLLRLRTYAPTVFMCHDASDKTWAPFLDDFIRNDVFTTMVSIDGNLSWHHRPQDITALTPHDQRFYQ